VPALYGFKAATQTQFPKKLTSIKMNDLSVISRVRIQIINSKVSMNRMNHEKAFRSKLKTKN